MKKLLLTFLLCFILTSCYKDTSLHNKAKFDAYVESSLKRFRFMVSLMGRTPDGVKLEKELEAKLSEIQAAHLNANDPTEAFLAKIKLIEYYKEQLHYNVINIDDLEAYLVELSPDSSLVLFDVINQALEPTVYLKDGDSAYRASPQINYPLTINLKASVKDYSERFALKDTTDLGLYILKTLGGLDKEVRLNRRIKVH